jgi:APA family basic amino acid/polyamine antiporter
MIGTGVFTTAGLLVRDLGSAPAVLAAWAVGGLLALCGALSYAELGAALPRNGGEYLLLGRIYHPSLGFAAGIVSLVVGFSAPLAASALAFGHYLAALLPGLPPAGAALAVVALLALPHALHVRLGGRIQTAATGLEVGLVLAFGLAGALLGDPARLAAAAPPGLATGGAGAFAVALVYVSFAYAGWNGAVYLAGEVRDPSRTLPRALLAGTAVVAGIYLLLNAVFLSAAPAEELAGVVEVGHVAAVRLLGPAAGRALSALVALALASSVSALLMAGPRVYEAMGRDHPALALLARRTRAGGPAPAVALQAAAAAVMIATASFGALLVYVGFTLSVVSGLAVAGVFVLRRREPGLPRPYRAFGYPVTPALFVALSCWMVARALLERPAATWAGLATLAAGILLHRVVRVGVSSR